MSSTKQKEKLTYLLTLAICHLFLPLIVSMLKEKVSKEYEKKDGLKSIEIISEEISEDGNTATVKIKQTYGNGETHDATQSNVKRDGKWLISEHK